MTEPNSNWAQPEGTPPSGSAAPITPIAAVPVAKPKKKGGGVTNVLLAVAALIAVGGITFAVGRATAPAAASGLTGRGTGQGIPPGGGIVPGGSFDPTANGGAAGFNGFGNRSMTISGTVKSIDGTTMTITTENGTETTVDISGSTYHSQAAATASDVTAGASVSVAVAGIGGFRPDASGAPAASGDPGSATITATDVTITAK